MRVLVANDDGIDADGLALAAAAAARLGDDVWIMAPDAKRTAAGASLTIAQPLVIRRLSPRRYACSGTPADCVIAAMAWLFRDQKRPDLVIAGVNDGRNVGEDLAYSGTLGVAREATFWGVPAISLSRVKRPNRQDGDAAWLARLIGALWESRDGWAVEGHWLSINLPASLPARFSQPRIGRDKIARTATVVREEPDVVELVVPRGRAHNSIAGDENSLIDQGSATINRLNWFGETPLAQSLVDDLARTDRGEITPV